MHLTPKYLAVALLLLLGGCASQGERAVAPDPDQVRAEIVRLIPVKVNDRQAWATDIYAAFAAQDLEPSRQNLCSVLAVTEQESTYQANPSVPGLATIARREIDSRAARLHIPGFLVQAALGIRSPNGKSYSQRLATVRSETELSELFDDFIGMVPLGQQLFGTFNPVRTGGPMQVSVAFAEQQARGYPYPVEGSIRREVFTRRGGMYFGIAHLLGYPAHYDTPLYRFADFNAGWYASRNAAFQNAVSRLSGIALALDGDLIIHGSATAGSTELAARTLGKRLSLSDREIRRALEKGQTLAFEDTDLYEDVFAMADQSAGKALPRAVLPGITLKSPKITRNLTTAWFAERVNERYRHCLQR